MQLSSSCCSEKLKPDTPSIPNTVSNNYIWWESSIVSKLICWTPATKMLILQFRTQASEHCKPSRWGRNPTSKLSCPLHSRVWVKNCLYHKLVLNNLLSLNRTYLLSLVQHSSQIYHIIWIMYCTGPYLCYTDHIWLPSLMSKAWRPSEAADQLDCSLTNMWSGVEYTTRTSYTVLLILHFYWILSDASAQLSWRHDGRPVTPIFEQNPTSKIKKKTKTYSASWCLHTPDTVATKERSSSTPSAMTKHCPVEHFWERKDWGCAQTPTEVWLWSMCQDTLEHMGTENKENVSIVENTEFWHFKSQQARSWETDKHFSTGQQNCRLRRGGWEAPGLSGSRLEWSWAGLARRPNGCQQPRNSKQLAAAFSATVYGGPATKYTLDKNHFHEYLWTIAFFFFNIHKPPLFVVDFVKLLTISKTLALKKQL